MQIASSCALAQDPRRRHCMNSLNGRPKMGTAISAPDTIPTLDTLSYPTRNATVLTKPRTNRDSTSPSSRSSSTRQLANKDIDDSPPGITRKSTTSKRFSSQRLSLLSLRSFPAALHVHTEPATSSSICPPEEAAYERELLTQSPTTDEMSAELLKSVAKKTSLRNILCDKSSTVEETSDADVEAAIALLQELKKKASPEDLVALHRALLPSKASDEVPTVEEPIVSPYSRRSSIVPPGVATRSSKSPLKSKASREKVETPKKRRPLSESGTGHSFWSPLKNSSKHQSINGVIGLKADNPLSRSYTPADLDIASIGTHRLGTLRVTNGNISPEPSIHSVPEDLNRKAIHTNDYFTKSDARHRADSHANPQTTPKQPNTVTSPIPGLEGYVDSDDDDDDDEPGPSPMSPQSASALAEEYGSECQPSNGPYTHALNMSVGSFVSRLSTIHDEGTTVDEPVQDADHALKRLTAGAYEQSPPPSSGSDSARAVPQRARPSPQIPSASLERPTIAAEGDSGYGSELPTLHGNQLGIQYSDEDEIYESAHDHSPVHSPAHSHFQTPIKRPRTAIPSSIVTNAQTASSPLSIRSAYVPYTPKATDSPLQRSAKHYSLPPMPHSLPPSSPAESVSSYEPFHSASQDASQEKAMKIPRKKLHKPAPHQRTGSGSFETGRTPDSAEGLPNVPDDLSVNFSRRISRITGSFHPEHAYAATAQAVPAEDSDEKRGSRWGTDPLTDRSDSDGQKTPKAKESSAVEVESEGGSSLQKKKSRFRLRGRSRSKSMSQPAMQLPRDDDIPTVAETVPQYAEIIRAQEALVQRDQTPAKPSPQRRGSSLTRYYAKGDSAPPTPVQEVPTPKIGMDEETARQLARRKSRDYVPGLDRDARRRSQSRPRGRPEQERQPMEDLERDGSTPRPVSHRSRSAHSRHTPRSTEHPDLAALDMKQRPQMGNRQRSSSMSARITRGSDHDTDEDRPPVPQLPRSGHFVPTKAPSRELGWDESASVWRDRRKTLKDQLVRSNSEDVSGASVKKAAAPNSPAVIVSRYVTPPTLNLSGRTKSQDVAFPTQGAMHPLASNPKDPRPAKEDVPRTDSSTSSASYRTANSSTSANSSAISRTSTPLTAMSANARPANVHTDQDGSYRAYRASDAMTMNKLTSPIKKNYQAYSQPRSMTLPAEGVQDVGKTRGRDSQPKGESVIDRFSGGLDYGWERGSGFSGSAGTRSKSQDKKARRKSVVLSENYGIDLSDVPVFVAKMA